MILTYPHFDPDVPLTPPRASDPKLRVYRVKRVVDSVEYTPGQFLRRETRGRPVRHERLGSCRQGS